MSLENPIRVNVLRLSGSASDSPIEPWEAEGQAVITAQETQKFHLVKCTGNVP
jgi:hypothetical protein